MNDALTKLALSDEGFVFNPQTGDSFQVSETGMVVLRELKAGCSDEETAQRLTAAFDVTLEEARRDCADFRARLQQFGLA
jgi:hypothetical protein